LEAGNKQQITQKGQGQIDLQREGQNNNRGEPESNQFTQMMEALTSKTSATMLNIQRTGGLRLLTQKLFFHLLTGLSSVNK
jgi:hypothetical protein